MARYVQIQNFTHEKGPVIPEHPKKWMKKTQTSSKQWIKTSSPSYDVESLKNANFGKRGHHPLKIFFPTYRRNESVVVTKVRFSLTPQARQSSLKVGWDIPVGWA